MTVRTKDELLALFADNNTGAITAAMLRDFVISNLAVAPDEIDSSPYTVDPETDAAVIQPGASFIELPPVAEYKDRSLALKNRRGQSVVIAPAPGETIAGRTSVTLEDGFDAILIATRNGWQGDVSPSISSMQNRAGEVLTVAPGETSPRWRNIWHVLNEAGPVPPP